MPTIYSRYDVFIAIINMVHSHTSTVGVPFYEVRARHVFSGSPTFQGAQVEIPSENGQKW
jgi:hypothetical protein